MTKKLKKILTIGLIAALAIAVAACSGNEEIEYQDYTYDANVVTDINAVGVHAGQVAETEITDIEYIDYEEKYPAGILELFEHMAAFSDMRTLDTSVIISVGLDSVSASPLTYEHLVGLLEMLIIEEISGEGFADMRDILGEYSVQLRISIAYDESFNGAFSIGLPSVNGGFVDVFSVAIIDQIVYLGIEPYIELASDIIATLLDAMVAEGMSPMEASMLGIIAGDIIGRFDGTQYLAIDLGDFIDLSEFDYFIEQTSDWQEFIFDALDAILTLIPVEMLIEVLSDMDILSMDDDWVVIEFSEQDARRLMELMFDWIGRNAGEVADVLNSIMGSPLIAEAMDMIVPFDPISAEEIRDAFGYADWSFFDEFKALFTIRLRSDGDKVYEEVVALVSAGEDFAIRVSVSGHSAVRAQPVSAPSAQAVMTLRELFDNVLIDFTGMTYDEFLYYYVPVF